MGWVSIKEKAEDWIKKYRYVILVVIIGLVLMNIPTKKKEDPIKVNTAEVSTTADSETEAQRLEQILRQIRGVGDVKVLLTMACGQQTVYQTDTDLSGESGSRREQTVIITDSARANMGLVTRVDAPIYQGAVIVCSGGDDPAVRLAVVDAVSKALGLGSDKISVLKMK